MITDFLVICTANRCRSPIAGALLQRAFAQAGTDVGVETAGFLEAGHPVPEGVTGALAREGIDAAPHRSRTLTPEMVAAAGVVVTMERAHVRRVVVMDPSAWPRTFTLKELVRRGEHIGPRGPDESPAQWLAAVHHGRRSADLLGADDTDDVVDPMGGPQRAFDRTADEIDDLTRRLTLLLLAPAATGSGSGAHAWS